MYKAKRTEVYVTMHRKVRKVIMRGIEYYVLDILVDGKVKMVYGHTEEELRRKVQKTVNAAEVEYIKLIPTIGTLSDYISYFIRGLERFGTNINEGSIYQRFYDGSNEESFMINRLMIEHYSNINKMVISQLKFFKKSIVKLTDKEYQMLNTYCSCFYNYDIKSELDYLIKNAVYLANKVNQNAVIYNSEVFLKKISVPSEKYFLNKEEYNAVIDYLLSHKEINTDNQGALTLLYFTGIKVQEALDVKGKDIDFSAHTLTVGEREIDLDNRCISWLKEMKENKVYSFEENVPLFATAYSVDYVNRMSKKVLMFLGLPILKPTYINCSHILFLAETGKSPEYIMAYKNIALVTLEKYKRQYNKFIKIKESIQSDLP